MATHKSPMLFDRTLQLNLAGLSDARDITVHIGLPERDSVPGGDFRVLVEIEGFEQPYARHFYGVDQLQAFLAGCWIVPHILHMLAPAGSVLTWLGNEDLGFEASSPTLQKV